MEYVTRGNARARRRRQYSDESGLFDLRDWNARIVKYVIINMQLYSVGPHFLTTHWVVDLNPRDDSFSEEARLEYFCPFGRNSIGISPGPVIKEGSWRGPRLDMCSQDCGYQIA
jgi:hypothetical protein